MKLEGFRTVLPSDKEKVFLNRALANQFFFLKYIFYRKIPVTFMNTEPLISNDSSVHALLAMLPFFDHLKPF